jgi:mRNA interferase RelE/StbE
VKYRLIIRGSAEKEFQRLSHEIQRRLAKKLLLLETNPFPAGVIALQGREGFRIRMGDYRVLYQVNEAAKEVHITAIGHRGDIYR